MLKWKIGDTTITQVLEITDGSGSLPLLPDATPEAQKNKLVKTKFRNQSGTLDFKYPDANYRNSNTKNGSRHLHR